MIIRIIIIKFIFKLKPLKLNEACWIKDDVDLYEINEAYAAVSLSINKELNIDESKVNVNGGAIAVGKDINFNAILKQIKV